MLSMTDLSDAIEGFAGEVMNVASLCNVMADQASERDAPEQCSALHGIANLADYLANAMVRVAIEQRKTA
ncbi:MAG TPA: hypothetical protein VF503_09205 [Sphingobium sp.]|uniref:hypothetical protein n=1 Tax=Sphingobium sp. TaxID=1912891 RepID=UPI002ED436DE